MEKEEIDKITNEIDKDYRKSLSKKEKKEIEEKIKDSTIEEIENDLNELINIYKNKILNDAIKPDADTDFLKMYFSILKEGEYVISITKDVDKSIKDEYFNIMRRIKLTIEYIVNYYISNTEVEFFFFKKEMDANTDFFNKTIKQINNKENLSSYDKDSNNLENEVKEIQIRKENAKKIYNKYFKKYEKTFWKYIDGEECNEEIENMKKAKEKLTSQLY